MDFLEDLFEGLTERKKHGKHKHGHYDNYDKHDYNNNQHRDKDAYQHRCFCPNAQ